MPKVSIIVPVYNVEKYLPKCLDSLLEQTFSDIEIICVNDGSTDGSGEILKLYAQRDSRIKIVTKENGGLFSARHEGMLYVKGEYILFVDSDDWVKENLVQECLDAAKNLPDMIIFGAYSVREKKGKIIAKRGGYDYSKIPAKYRHKTFNKTDFKKDIFKFPPTAWSKMYRTEFIKNNNIRFQEIKNGEDQLFFIHSMLLADKINVVNDNHYYYIKSRAGAITKKKKKTSLSPVDNVYAIENLLDELDIDEEYRVFILGKYFKKSLSWYTKSSDDISAAFYNAITVLREYLTERYPKCWWSRLYLKERISYWNLKWNILTAQMFGVSK